ncbi:hypothetical protein AVEN_78059-1 [Araneus ventricosus]|uniref:Uncharacterized protein n=1 Tax=Araneus ventricosus TaxID=182803 RepID=A0A4Y2VBB5_ARAVE|nr:hypothetical protein AVEN_78059-1 [Araneus ventricosus]
MQLCSPNGRACDVFDSQRLWGGRSRAKKYSLFCSTCVNHTSELHPNDLALYIHALIATRRNPRDFYGIDLVSRLSHLVSGSYYQAHPFLLLALCNANEKPDPALSFPHWMQQNRHFGKDSLDYRALALNAFQCLKTLKYSVDERYASEVGHGLAALQLPDGSFGNVYTTALVVQALASAPNSLDWDRQKALVYLRSQSTVDVNMVSTYLIQLALNADRVKFIKDLYPNLIFGPPSEGREESRYFVQYTVRAEENPDVYFTISMKVPPRSNFYHIMSESARRDAKFNELESRRRRASRHAPFLSVEASKTVKIADHALQHFVMSVKAWFLVGQLGSGMGNGTLNMCKHLRQISYPMQGIAPSTADPSSDIN